MISRTSLVVALLLVASPSAAGQPLRVVVDAGALAGAPPGSRDARAVEVDAEALAAAAVSGADIAIEAGGRRFVASPTSVVRRPAGISWYGRTPDDGRVTLSLTSGHLFARIATPETLLLVEPAGELHVAYSPGPYPEHRYDAVSPPPDAGAVAPQAPETLFPDELHLMIAYTPALAAALGAALPAFLQASEDVVNDVLQNSLVPFRARLVYAHGLTYNESGNMSTDLSRIRGLTDGHMDEVHELRTAYSADLVALMVQTASANCGVAYLMDPIRPEFEPNGFSATLRSCAIGNLTFPHELGHNLGLRHDRFVDQSNTPFTYSHGFVNDDSLGPGRPGIRTTLAYNDQCTSQGGTCTRVPFYSDPALTFGGQVLGDSVLAHNARAATFSLPTVAGFRAAELLATDDGDTATEPYFRRPHCPAPGDLTLCVEGDSVRYQARTLQAAALGLHHVRVEAGHEAVVLIYEDFFDPAAPLQGLVAYAEPDSTAPAIRRLLASAALEEASEYIVVVAGRGTDDAGPFDLAVYGPADGGIVVHTDDEGAGDAAIALGRPSPNPFREVTSVAFVASTSQSVRVELFDVLGRRVASLMDGPVAAGLPSRVTIPGAGLAPGAYVLRFTGAEFARSVRLTRLP